MKAIVLAGGYGTRLGELTKTTPKPMIKIGNKPVIGHIVDNLREAGITEIIVKVHYLPDKIMEYLGDKVLYYYEPVLFEWDKTLEGLKNWINDEPFLLINGDTVSEIDYKDMVDKFDDNSILTAMDDWRCMGSWIYPKYYSKEDKYSVVPYRPKVSWFDIGKPDRLEAAKKHYELGEKQLCP